VSRLEWGVGDGMAEIIEAVFCIICSPVIDFIVHVQSVGDSVDIANFTTPTYDSSGFPL
jgi:hypothetical protein